MTARITPDEARALGLLPEAPKAAKGKQAKGKRRGSGPEQLLQNAILDALNYLPGVEARRQNSGKVKTQAGALVSLAPAGTSDIGGWVQVWMPVGVVPRPYAVVLAIEVKTATGKVTPMQKAYLARVKEAGGCAFVARSVDEAVEGVKAFQRGEA